LTPEKRRRVAPGGATPAAAPHPQTPCYHARQDGKMNAATNQNAPHHKIVIGDAR